MLVFGKFCRTVAKPFPSLHSYADETRERLIWTGVWQSLFSRHHLAGLSSSSKSVLIDHEIIRHVMTTLNWLLKNRETLRSYFILVANRKHCTCTAPELGLGQRKNKRLGHYVAGQTLNSFAELSVTSSDFGGFCDLTFYSRWQSWSGN